METDFDFGLDSGMNLKADVPKASSVKVTRLLPSQARHLELLSHLASWTVTANASTFAKLFC